MHIQTYRSKHFPIFLHENDTKEYTLAYIPFGSFGKAFYLVHLSLRFAYIFSTYTFFKKNSV